MPENEVPTPDPAADPETPTEGASDQTPQPEAEKSAEPALSPEQERWSQALFTKVTQEHKAELKALREEIATLRSERSQVPAAQDEAEDPRVDAVLGKSRLVRAQQEEIKRLRETVSSVAEVALSQALISQYPDLKDDFPTFTNWLKEVPGRAAAIQAGILSEKSAIAAFRAEHPAKRGSAPKGTPKVPPRVETVSAPRGTVRDIRDKLREKGVSGRVSAEAAFDTAVDEARRELKAAE